MNSLIQLKGSLKDRGNPSRGGGASLASQQVVTIESVNSLLNDLIRLKSKWENNDVIDGALISVYYTRIVPKSKRISKLFSIGNESSNLSIVGAKFNNLNMHKHVITHYLTIEQLDKSISRINLCKQILETLFSGTINNDGFEYAKKIKSKIEKYGLSVSAFCTYISDVSNVEKFGVLDNSDLIKDDSIITLYDINVNIKSLLEKIGISISTNAILSDNTVYLNYEDALKLKNKAPYLISMSVTDISDYKYEDFDFHADEQLVSIPAPTNEPVVGVIDTLFDDKVYFKDWVEYEDWVDPEIPKEQSSYIHGTAVSSIIVDGPTINPDLDDGCGRFRVKHFGVAISGKNSSSSIVRNIKKIVEANKNIKVWNISLGSPLEINPNFISPESALLDEIQYKNDVVFIIAGTNKGLNYPKDYKIGAPADSINSIVVNAVDNDNNIASYSRKGKVLSFFNKPDVCYYGGDDNGAMMTCIGTGAYATAGTSFAAPWITRKVAYLIGKLGLTREIAKALVIDSAIGWNMVDEEKSDYLGFGVVPKRIEDIVNSPKNEIKFYIEGITNSYETYAHNIPIPMSNDKYPFLAKATLCYFPKCSRNQGVDYTNTELDIYFGRIKDDGTISSINKNNQSEGAVGFVNEEGAREYYRKWDNVKHINQEIKTRIQPSKSYRNKMWGLSIKSKERLGTTSDEIKFGVLITLKEIYGYNRCDDFIKQCSVNGWITNKVEIENRLEIYENADVEIEFE